MRTRRRIAALVVSAAALGVGFIAFPSGAAAAPPVVPTCAFPNTAGSDSCGTIRTTAVAAPIGSAYENIKLGVRVRSQFSPATSENSHRRDAPLSSPSNSQRHDIRSVLPALAIHRSCPESQ